MQDLYETKNELFDETGVLEVTFKKLMDKSMLYSKADDTWAAKKQVCSHAFM